MPTKKLDLSWMDGPPPPKPKPRVPPVVTAPPNCCECGDRDAWYGFHDLWFCALCAPVGLRRPTESNIPL